MVSSQTFVISYSATANRVRTDGFALHGVSGWQEYGTVTLGRIASILPSALHPSTNVAPANRSPLAVELNTALLSVTIFSLLRMELVTDDSHATHNTMITLTSA